MRNRGKPIASPESSLANASTRKRPKAKLLPVRKAVTLTRAVVAVTAAALTLAGAGCGSGSSGRASMTPRAMDAAARRAFANASSVHLSGAIHQDGETASFDLEIGNRGGKGTMSTDGFRFKFIGVPGYVYVEPSAAYWKAEKGAAAAKRYAGVWLRGSATKGYFAPYGPLLNKMRLTRLLDQGPRVKELTEGPEATVNGQAAVTLKSKALGETLYVAAKGTPYPLAVAKSGNVAYKYDFSGYNHPVSVAAPKHWINQT
jgi:hypothetical protein